MYLVDEGGDDQLRVGGLRHPDRPEGTACLVSQSQGVRRSSRYRYY